MTAVSPYFRRGERALRNPKLAWQYLVSSVSSRVETRFNYGLNYFAEDWDHLVVLDACRYDLFAEFAPRHSAYGLIDAVDAVYSNASCTPVWLSRTIGGTPPATLAEVRYVSCTPFITGVDTSHLADVEHVWRYAYDPDAGVTTPGAVTDAAIESYRADPSLRSVIHYVQPHAPFLHCVGKYDSRGDEDGGTQNIWHGLRDGTYDPADVWRDYGRNLLTVLDHVETLVRNLGGDVVVTSDHGNAFGEYGIYGHPRHVPIPPIRRVPWARTTGREDGSYEVRGVEEVSTGVGPEELKRGATDRRRDEQLEALGYKV
jgi:hypothetical protein